PAGPWLRLQEQLLLRLSREPESPDFQGGTLKTNLDTALSFLSKTVPDFLGLIKGKKILDFGCGWGWQAVAMVLHGADCVVGVDILDESLNKARKRAGEYFCSDRC